MRLALFTCAISLLAAGLVGCNDPCADGTCLFTASEWKRLQSLADLGDPPPDPSNKYAGHPLAEKLGQRLYFDPGFSGDATLLDMLRRPAPYARAPKGMPTAISCATCHNPARAGADFTSTPAHVSIGAGWYDVNSQQTLNAGFWTLMYWNGRNDSVWSQIVAVTESFVSMASNRLKVAWRLYTVYRAEYDAVFPEYPLPFDAADASARFPLQGRPGAHEGCQAGDPTEPFGDAFDCMTTADQHTITRIYVNFAKAIAAYEHRLVSKNALFDRFVAAGPKSDLLTPEQKRGAQLFVSKANCIDCHNTPLFSDNGFHNIGIAQQGDAVPTEIDCPEAGVCDCVKGKNCLPWGSWDGLTKLQANGFRRTSEWSDDPSDTSREAFYDLTIDDRYKGAWRTPSLRDVELTAPYMHNGVYATLEDVLWHYAQGGAIAGPTVGQKSVHIAPLHLTDGEQRAIIAFLRSLTGEALPVELVTKP